MSDHLINHLQKTRGAHQQSPRTNSTFQPPSLSLSQDHDFTLPVRWQGRFYSVSLPSIRRTAFSELPAMILAKLHQTRKNQSDDDSPLIYFYGCSPNSSSPKQIVRLRACHEPRCWEELIRLKHQVEFVEIQHRLRGGADRGQDTAALTSNAPSPPT